MYVYIFNKCASSQLILIRRIMGPEGVRTEFQNIIQCLWCDGICQDELQFTMQVQCVVLVTCIPSVSFILARLLWYFSCLIVSEDK